METHPIPQQISSYHFRLVGDMTLKQFFQIAGGALISLLFYASNLHPLIKWPFIFFFSLLGFALAFLPYEDRPLEKWIISFFKSIYSPTIFYWQKIHKQPVFFQDEGVQPSGGPQERIIAPQGKEKMEEYLKKTPFQKLPFLSILEEKEKAFLNAIGNIFNAGGPLSGQTVIEQAAEQPQKMVIPEVQPVSFMPKRKRMVIEEKPLSQTQDVVLQKVSQTFQEKPTTATIGAKFSLEAAPPSPPTIPNTVVGQVIGEKGKIIEGAILEVKDAAGRPVRALKSNKLGHFIIITPLQNGRYEVFTEKDGFVFKPVYFETQGKIVPPIAIQGKTEIKAVTSEVKN